MIELLDRFQMENRKTSQTSLNIYLLRSHNEKHPVRWVIRLIWCFNAVFWSSRSFPPFRRDVIPVVTVRIISVIHTVAKKRKKISLCQNNTIPAIWINIKWTKHLLDRRCYVLLMQILHLMTSTYTHINTHTRIANKTCRENTVLIVVSHVSLRGEDWWDDVGKHACGCLAVSCGQQQLLRECAHCIYGLNFPRFLCLQGEKWVNAMMEFFRHKCDWGDQVWGRREKNQAHCPAAAAFSRHAQPKRTWTFTWERWEFSWESQWKSDHNRLYNAMFDQECVLSPSRHAKTHCDVTTEMTSS